MNLRPVIFSFLLVFSFSFSLTAQQDNIIITEDSADGGCNSRGGGPASLGLLMLSMAPLYLINRSRKRKIK